MRIRASAGTRSPASMLTMSPGTSWSIGRSTSSPLRRVFALTASFCAQGVSGGRRLALLVHAHHRVAQREEDEHEAGEELPGQEEADDARDEEHDLHRVGVLADEQLRARRFLAAVNLFGPTLARRASASAEVRPCSTSTPCWRSASSGLRAYQAVAPAAEVGGSPRTVRCAVTTSSPSCGLLVAAFFAAFSAARPRSGPAAAPAGAGPRARPSAPGGVARLRRDLRVARVDLDQGVGQDAGRGHTGERLVVGRDDVPGRPVRAGLAEDVAERLLVVVPVAPLLGVVGAELPVLLGLVDPGEEPAALLLLADVQEELDEAVALVGQVVLPVVDLAEAPVPDAAVLELGRDLLAREDLRVDPDDQDLLVVGAVEDADVAALRQLLRVAPQVVVVEVLGRGILKLLTWTPWGLTPLMTWRIVPSLPAASIAWRTMTTPYVSWAARRIWYSASSSAASARISFASALVASGGPDVSKSLGSRTRRRAPPGTAR